MAELPDPMLFFDADWPPCDRAPNSRSEGDPGRRLALLPAPLPEVGDDFDWQLRDYDGFRMFMLDELRSRFPERQRWTAADLEVVLIEVLAAALDQLSDMADRAAAEGALQTARRPESVARWLRLIGLDMSKVHDAPDGLVAFYRDNPLVMERDRHRGPELIRRQRRMVSLHDHGAELEKHPLVFRARAIRRFSGSWPTVWIMVIAWRNIMLDEHPSGDPGFEYPKAVAKQTELFHKEHGLHLDPSWRTESTIRDLLRSYVRAYRMADQEVVLIDVVPVGVELDLCVRVRDTYFVSEVRHAVQRALGRGPGGFFEAGRMTFGQDLWASDIFERVMSLEGVESIHLDRLARVGREASDQVVLRIDDDEVAVCDSDFRAPHRGRVELTLVGGRKG